MSETQGVGTHHDLPRGSGVEIFEEHYAGKPGAGWEIDRPQRALVELARRGVFRGRVLDIGCGSGDNALMLAERGLETTGVDAAPSGIELAREKAARRGLEARFLVRDVLRLKEWGERFDTVLDVGLFHCFPDEDRPALVEGVSAVTVPGGRYVLMCFSDRQPGTRGPRRVSEQEIRTAFARGWRIEVLRPVELEVAFEPGVARAWLAVMTRR
ncbi:class I SAM-dependent methyltransferase [Streptomyces sp. ST2-7A]|uniref:class I SAM-dependent methyltransferase n=1 Tax=Streptomyces sp. ST2-7A TaxID=2907214 RepID=UPI001F44A51B|nr:class I SAM-dependent methyltransferase [Streptomyces sp. ST2-7A]MCE7080559.1 class I SAM-dependent methyltransferase [Streptomyces sp. ST2-7A]